MTPPWGPTEWQKVLRVLGQQRKGEINSVGVAALSKELGHHVSADTLKHRLKAAGLGRVSDWCLDRDVNVVEDETPVKYDDCKISFGGVEFNGPVVLSVKYAAPELERILVVPDCHHPYVDQVAWSTMLTAARSFKPTRVIVLGDFGDFYATNRHRKDPNRATQLEHEVAACNAALDELDALGCKHKHFIFGNHCDNLSRYLADHAPALFNMVKVEQLFRLAERGWSWTPYGKHYQCGKVYYAHDPSGCGAQAHVKAGAKFGHSIVHGHTHRAAASYFGNATGEKRVCMMAGWLGDNAAATYHHDIGKEHEWMHSFAVGHMEQDGTTHLQLVPIINGRCCINGRIVSGATLSKQEAA